MSIEQALTLFERAAEARGQLLRAEAEGPVASPVRLLLTFDVGRILVEPRAVGFVASQLEISVPAPSGLRALDEEEPWWRLLGHPLTGVSLASPEDAASPDVGGLLLRFRELDANPVTLRLIPGTGSVSVGVLKH